MGPNDPVMLYVGRIAAEKNLGLMIDCYERLRQKEPKARLVLVGDGPEKPKLEVKYPHFIFMGKRTGIDLARHYASADLFIFSSHTETYGNVIMEAMASGLKVLCYDYACARENIVHGQNGYLAAHRNENNFKERFEELLASRHLWPQIALAARETATKLSWENVIAKYEQTLLGLKSNA